MNTTNRLHSLKWLAWLLTFSLVLILIVLPLLTSSLIRNDLMPPGFIKVLDVFVRIQAFALGTFTVAWIFFFGSCIASFLNVVAWRVPRGRSILGSSHCPFCNSKLAFKDNFPVIGWLRNGGRCRTCRLPISPRYLVAEIILGSIFLLMVIVQLNGGGINLPFRPTDGFRGFETLLFDPRMDLLLLLIMELALLSSLFTYALVKSEDLAIPTSMFLIPIVIGIGFPLIWPQMSLVNWHNGYETDATGLGAAGQALTTSLIGGAVGFAAGWFLGRSCSRGAPHATPFEIAGGMACIGIYLGWQSVFSISIIFVCINIVTNLWSESDQRSPMSRFFSTNQFATLLLATLVHLLSWRAQTTIPFWLTFDQAWTTLLAGIAILGLLLFVAGRLPSKSEHSDLKTDNVQ